MAATKSKKTPAAKSQKKPATKSTKKAPKKSAAAREKFDLEARLAGVSADLAQKDPDMPAAALSKDAAELARVVKPYVARLLALPDFNGAFLLELLARADALAETKLSLDAVRKRAVGKTGGTHTVAGATKLRADMLGGARFLFRKDADVLAILDAIAEGEGLDDLIADLKALADLAEDHTAIFATDGALPKDVHLVARAAAESLLGRTDTSEVTLAVARRNRAFWLTDEAFNEVYDGLGYLLRGGDVRREDLFRTYRARNAAASRLRAANNAKKKPVQG